MRRSGSDCDAKSGTAAEKLFTSYFLVVIVGIWLSRILDISQGIVHDGQPVVLPRLFMSPSRFFGSSLLTLALLMGGAATASAADISLAVSGPSSVDRGQTYTYNLTVRNNESATFGDFSVVFNINGAGGILANTTYQSVSRGGCTVSNGSTVTCTGFNLAGYTEQAFTLTVRANTDATCGATVDFIGSIVYGNINQSSRWSNTSRAIVNCGSGSSSTSSYSSSINNNGYVDLSITQNGPSTINRGNSPRYTLTAYNGGSITAQNVIISNTIPSGLTFQPSLSSAGCTQNGSSVDCNVGSIPAGQQKNVDVVFSMPNGAYNCGDSYVNRGYVATSSGDTNGNNNATSLTTYVHCDGGNHQNLRGCIEIQSTVYDLSGREVANPGFTVSLSNGARVTTDRSGNARFYDVPVGNYNLSISLYSSYSLDSQSPNNGNVYVDDSGCERVYFRIVSRTNNPYGNRAQCEDGIDNDGDRRYDYPGDPDCSSYSDNSEYGSRYSSSSSRYYTNNSYSSRSNYTYYNTDPYVAQVQAYANAQNRRGGVTIDKRVDRLEALPGGAVSYTITIRNDGSANVRDVELEDRFDNRMRPISVTQGGAIGGGRIIWNLGTIAANSTKTVRVRMQLDGSVRNGDMLSNSATARGSFGTVSDSVSVRVVTQLPATGIDLVSLFGSPAAAAALPMGLFSLLGLAGAGVGAGGMFGRRFL